MNIKMNFIGTDTQYLTANGERKNRLHLDAAASPLAASIAVETIEKLLPHYSNSHSYVHSSAQISTKALAWAHDTILGCVGANKELYTAIFTGSGTTSASNRLARGLASSRTNKKIVLISSMEHHANDLPHRQFNNQVIHIPLMKSSQDEQLAHSGAIDLIALKELCEAHSGNINYIAVSTVSNVTGIINPIKEIALLAHKHGALIVVDAAQSVAHRASMVEDDNIDFMMFSGHKVYSPTSPGVLIGKRELLRTLPEQDLGGGSVSTVSPFDHELVDSFPDREQSGTPNIIGAITLAKVMQALASNGFDNIERHSIELTHKLISELSNIDGMHVYGDLSLPRVGAVAFNHKDIDHGLFAAILNDYFAIAVRNECFCAHPYVSHLLKEQLWELDLSDVDEDKQESYINLKRGMVRASVSLYTKESDIDFLVDTIKSIIKDLDYYHNQYDAHSNGSYTHKTFNLDWTSELSL